MMRDDTLEQHQQSVALFSFFFCFMTLATVLFAALGNGVLFPFESSDSPETWVRDSQELDDRAEKR
jgi:hypothetical protein